MKQPIKVVMLPTEDNSNLGLLDNSRLGYIPDMYYNSDWKFVDKNWKRQHLYITVSQDVEMPKIGDWVYDTETNEVKKYTKDCV